MIKYAKDETTGTVTATITDCSNDVVIKLRNVFASTLEEADKIAKAATISNQFTGKAKCHPDDEFDEAVGREIARKRLMDKYHKARIKALNRVDNILDERSKDIMRLIQHEIKTCKKHS